MMNLVRNLCSRGTFPVRFGISKKINPTIFNNKCQLMLKPTYRFSAGNNRPSDNDKPQSREDKVNTKEDELLKQEPLSQEEQAKQAKGDNKLATYLMGIATIALLMAYGMMEIQDIRVQKKTDKSKTGTPKIISTGKANIGGEWQLTTTTGQPFGSKDLDGTYYLIYFGFTNCPDICPNSLLKLTKAVQKLKKMPEYQHLNLKTVFISVDPDRDTPEKIDKFLSYFDKSIIGATGKTNNDPILKQCMKKFKIYASKIEFQDQNTVKNGRKSYTIDHTILTYLMSDTNDFITHIGGNLGEHDIAKIIIQQITDNEHKKMQLLKV